jgi:hypothetical protein
MIPYSFYLIKMAFWHFCFFAHFYFLARLWVQLWLENSGAVLSLGPAWHLAQSLVWHEERGLGLLLLSLLWFGSESSHGLGQLLCNLWSSPKGLLGHDPAGHSHDMNEVKRGSSFFRKFALNTGFLTFSLFFFPWHCLCNPYVRTLCTVMKIYSEAWMHSFPIKTS